MSSQESSASQRQSTTFWPERTHSSQHRRPLGRREVTRRPFTFIRNWETGESPVAAVLSHSQSSDLSLSSHSQEESVFVSPNKSQGQWTRQSPIPVVIRSPTPQVIPETQPSPVVQRLSSIAEHPAVDGGERSAAEDDDQEFETLQSSQHALATEHLTKRRSSSAGIGPQDGLPESGDESGAESGGEGSYSPDGGDEDDNDAMPGIVESPSPKTIGQSSRLQMSTLKTVSPSRSVRKQQKQISSTPVSAVKRTKDASFASSSGKAITPVNQSLGLTLKTPGSLLKSGVVSKVRKVVTDEQKVAKRPAKRQKRNIEEDQDFEDTTVNMWQGTRRRLPGHLMDLDILLNEIEAECFTFKERSHQKVVRNAIVHFFRNVQRDITNTIDMAEEVKSKKFQLSKASSKVRSLRKELLQIQRESSALKSELRRKKAEHEATNTDTKKMISLSKWMESFQQTVRGHEQDVCEQELEYDHEDNAEALLLEAKINLESMQKLKVYNDKLDECLSSNG